MYYSTCLTLTWRCDKCLVRCISVVVACLAWAALVRWLWASRSTALRCTLFSRNNSSTAPTCTTTSRCLASAPWHCTAKYHMVYFVFSTHTIQCIDASFHPQEQFIKRMILAKAINYVQYCTWNFNMWVAGPPHENQLLIIGDCILVLLCLNLQGGIHHDKYTPLTCLK